MLYSFPKTARFHSRRLILCDRYYDMPSTVNGCRTTSLGIGHKYDFTQEYSFIHSALLKTLLLIPTPSRALSPIQLKASDLEKDDRKWNLLDHSQRSKSTKIQALAPTISPPRLPSQHTLSLASRTNRTASVCACQARGLTLWLFA